MILGISGDTHFTTAQPKRRLDDYWETQKSKFGEALEIFMNKKCDRIIQPGDLVDSPNVSNIVMSVLISMLKKYRAQLDVAWGNHDVSGISSATLPTSPLSVLKAAGVINILNNEPRQYEELSENIAMYGAGFNEEPPTPKNPNDYNVLVIHAMVGNRPLFPGQELKNPKNFLKQHPYYNLVVCGHYHYGFVETYEGRTILNAGVLIRGSIAKFDLEHKPGVIIFDTNTNKVEIIELTIEPAEEVFDLTPAKKRDNEILNRFIDRLKTGSKSNRGWKHFLLQVLEKKNTSGGGKSVIDQCLEEVNAK